MNKLLAHIVLLVAAFPAVACQDIAGSYQSVSETHWHFDLEISSNDTKLTYSDYWYGIKDARTDLQTVSQGYCEKNNDGYLLTFAEKTILIKYHKSLSHAAYGAEGSSPGVTGEFIEGQTVNLWVSQ